MRRFIPSATALAVLALLSGNLVAQRPDGRGPARREVRGTIKAVDAAKGTITVALPGGRDREMPEEKTFTLVKDAEVGVSGGVGGRQGFVKAGKLADLTPGSSVNLVMTADEKQVEFVIGEGPMLRGVLKSVDAGKKALTIALAPTRREEAGEEKTVILEASAEIGVDDGRGRRFSVREAKLGDLTEGSLVTVWLTVDQKQAQGVLAEGPTLSGRVKAVDAMKNTLTLTTQQRGGDMEEKTFEVPKTAVTLIDDGRGRRFALREGKLSEVPTGSAVTVRLSPDQKQVALVRAEGPSIGGRVKAVDAAKGTVTLEIFVARGENSEEKTLPLLKNARIVIDGKEAKLADIKAGEENSFAQLRLSLDQKEIQSITIVNRSR